MKQLKKIQFNEIEQFYNTLDMEELSIITGGNKQTNDCVFKCMEYISNQLECGKSSGAYERSYDQHWESTDKDTGVYDYTRAAGLFQSHFSVYGSASNLSPNGIQSALNASAYVMAGFTPKYGSKEHVVIITDYDPNTGKYSYYDPQKNKSDTLKESDINFAIAATDCK